MKIWCQSGNPAGIVASAYAESVKRHVQAVARPDTIAELHGLEVPVVGADRYYSTRHVMGTLMVKAAVKAEREGYDAFACTCTLDPGLNEVKELVNIPVAYITESSLHLACQLAPKFGFVTHNQPMLLHLQQLARSYGLAEFMAGGASLNLTFEDAHQGIYDNPGFYVDAFAKTARGVIAQGADMLLTAGNPLNMFLLGQGAMDVDGVPVLDVCAAMVKTAEMLVDLKKVGVTKSRHGLFAEPTEHAQKTMLPFYGV